MTVSPLSTRSQHGLRPPRPPRVLDLLLRRLRAQVVARGNARAAAQAMAAVRQEREEVEAFLEVHLAERASGR